MSAATEGFAEAARRERDAQLDLIHRLAEEAEMLKAESQRLDTEAQGREYDAQVASANVRRLNAVLTGLGEQP